MRTTPSKSAVWKKRLSLLLAIALIIQFAVVVPTALAAKDLSGDILTPTLTYGGVDIAGIANPDYVFEADKDLVATVAFDVLTYSDVFDTISSGLAVAQAEAEANGDTTEKAKVDALLAGLKTANLSAPSSPYAEYYLGGTIPEYAEPGDYFEFEIPDFFLPPSGSGRPGVISAPGGRTLGEFKYSEPSTNGIVTVKFIFNNDTGDSNPIYPGDDCIDGFVGIFSTTKTVNSVTELVEALNKFKIGDLDFTFTPPVPVKSYALSKTGELQDGVIEWELEYTGKTDNKPTPLDVRGHEFSDILANVGAYVDGFVITDRKGNSVPVTEPSAGATNITFTLPDDIEILTPVTIKFNTALDPNIVYAIGNYGPNSDGEFESTITNTAIFKDADDVETATATDAVTFPTSIITKTGVSNNFDTFEDGEEGSGYLETGGEGVRYMIWTITTNDQGYSLTNACIDETMIYPDGIADEDKLTFNKVVAYELVAPNTWAVLETWGEGGIPMPASDAAGKIEFSLGTITKPVMLKIKALLPDRKSTRLNSSH